MSMPRPIFYLSLLGVAVGAVAWAVFTDAQVLTSFDTEVKGPAKVAQDAYFAEHEKYRHYAKDEFAAGCQVDEYITPEGERGWQAFCYDDKTQEATSFGEGNEAGGRSFPWSFWGEL